ncbi:MAG: hypothetical protein AAFS11_06845 [Planctomycetota bacterium]
MPTHLNIPPGPCPSCGKSLQMSQAVCFACGFDRVAGKNINDTPSPGPLWKRALGTPKRFLITTNSAAIILAVLTDGQPPLVRMYAIATILVAVVTAFVYSQHYANEISTPWAFFQPDAHDLYVDAKLFGKHGPWGMQCMFVLSAVMTITSIVLMVNLPPGTIIP